MATANDDLLLRRIAMEILIEAQKENVFGNAVLKQTLDKFDYFEAKKKAFIKKLAMGSLEKQIQLDYVIDLYAKPKTSQMKPVIRSILEIGVYQILFMDQVYDTLACNTCVTLARKKGFSSLSGFVNGILRRICREKEAIAWPSFEKDVLQYFHVCYSKPEWLVKLLMEQYGTETTEEILGGFSQEPETSIRIKESLSLQEREDLFEIWRKDGIQVKRRDELPYACLLKGTDRISNMAGFKEGKFIVQDISSMLVAECAGIKKGDVIFDVCASPGGKTLHAAEKLQGTGKVMSFDVSERKIDTIRENMERMNLTNIELNVQDATIFCPEYEETADILLADVPCSGLGVVARKQDIPRHLTPEKLESLSALQKEILVNTVKYLKKGGMLVYSTCTLNKQENDDNVRWILENLHMKPVSIRERLPECFWKYVTSDDTLQLYRGKMSCDGFFIALFLKEE